MGKRKGGGRYLRKESSFSRIQSRSSGMVEKCYWKTSFIEQGMFMGGVVGGREGSRCGVSVIDN